MILLNDFKKQWAELNGDLMGALQAVGESGWYILGAQVAQFETALATTWGMQHAVGVASGLDAIEIALRAAGCKPGDKVLTTSVSAFATALAIVKLGATAVFVECDDYGLVDLNSCRRACEQDSSIRFFVPVHLYGHALDLRKLEKLRDDFSLTIIEDCAQSILASSAGRPTGSVGLACATSFYPTKNLGAIGDGGAVLTKDKAFAAEVKVLRDYGQSAKYRHSVVGYNSRLDELQAAFLARVFLPRLPEWTARRSAIAEQYITKLKNPAVRVPGRPPHSCSVWHLFPVEVQPERKQDFIAQMKSGEVSVAEHYPIAMMDQPVMADVPHHIIDGCPRARRWCSGEVSLPIHPYLTDEDVERVIEVVNAWK